MWEIEEGGLVRFRCHVGHAYTAEMMNIAGDETVRRGLSAAQRGLEEKVALMKRMEERALERSQLLIAKSWQDRAEEYRGQAQTIEAAIRRLDELVKSAGSGFSRGRKRIVKEEDTSPWDTFRMSALKVGTN